MEAKYFKDYKYNYLILKCEETEAEGGYQQKMLASNKIDRILKCSVRNINGSAYYYYDISSKVTLENLYQGRKMSYAQVKDFLEQMDCIYGNLTKYFMEESGLLVQPEYIYYDISSQKYYGLYYPRIMKNREMPIRDENLYEPLMDFLLNHIDTENQKLVDNIYRIYELSEEQFFSLADALPFFEEVIEEDKHINYAPKEMEIEKTVEMPPVQEWKELERKEVDTDLPVAKGNRFFYGIFAVLSFCGLAGEFWIYWEYQLTKQELTMIISCAAITFLCFGFSLVQCVLSGRRNRKQAGEDVLLQQDIEDEFRNLRPVSIEGVLDYDMDIAIAGNDIDVGAQRNRRKNELKKEISDFGETIFIDLKHQKEEYKLYALDKKNKKHIELTKFPFTIGKMAGCVDCAITDESISRLHARIDRQDDKILLTDMNSTNGTYKNGLRMEPSETVEIEPGDEIRFGKVNYCYR